MKPKSDEKMLIGRWIEERGALHADATCERIERLTSQYFKKIAVSKQWGEWKTLFQDPADGRYWERTYPQSEMHGGGPPMLKCLSKEEAKAKYELGIT